MMQSAAYKSVSSINPKDMNLPNKYDPKASYSGGMRFDVLMVLIIHVFTLIYQWVAGVLGRFMEVFLLQVPHGTQVKRSVSGTLRPTLISPDLKTATTVSSALTTKAGIPIHLGRTLEKVASSLDVEKVAVPSAAEHSDTVAAIADTVS